MVVAAIIICLFLDPFSAASASNSSIIGEWSTSDGIYLTFFDDGTFMFEWGWFPAEYGTWSVSASDSESFPITMDGSSILSLMTLLYGSASENYHFEILKCNQDNFYLVQVYGEYTARSSPCKLGFTRVGCAANFALPTERPVTSESINAEQDEEFNGSTAEDSSYSLERFFRASDLKKGNNELALIAADLSMKTYDNGGLNANSVEGCLIYDFGFEKRNIYSSEYGWYEGSILSVHNPFAYTIATKPYHGADSGSNTDILVVVARGTQSLREYEGDMFSGTTKGHKGYEEYDIVSEFVKAITSNLYRVTDKNKNYKVFLTGHSLGGAAANLTAAMFIDRSIHGVTIKNPQTDVVCYTFGAIDSIRTDTTVSAGYENIHNIYNLSDNFGKFGWVFFTAAGNSIHGKFGHIDLFNDDRDRGSLTTIQNHDMGTYRDAVIADVQSSNRIYYENAEVQRLISFFCPVDVFIYKGNELVGQIVNNEVVESVTQIPMSVVDDAKYALIPDSEEYRVEITATDSGVMQFSCRDAATGNDAKTFTDVALEAGKTMTSTVGGEIETLDVKLYVVNDEGTPIAEILKDGTETPVKNDEIRGNKAGHDMTIITRLKDKLKDFPRWVYGVVALVAIIIINLVKKRKK